MMSRDSGDHLETRPDALGFHLDDESWLTKVRTAKRVPDGQRWIGPYLLRELIGQGGQGLVYRATQPGTGREVALKRLSAGVFATPEMRARFEREVEVSRRIVSPNVLRVEGLGRRDGSPFIVMEFVPEESLRERLRRVGPMTWSEAPLLLAVSWPDLRLHTQ